MYCSQRIICIIILFSNIRVIPVPHSFGFPNFLHLHTHIRPLFGLSHVLQAQFPPHISVTLPAIPYNYLVVLQNPPGPSFWWAPYILCTCQAFLLLAPLSHFIDAAPYSLQRWQKWDHLCKQTRVSCASPGRNPVPQGDSYCKELKNNFSRLLQLANNIAEILWGYLMGLQMLSEPLIAFDSLF